MSELVKSSRESGFAYIGCPRGIDQFSPTTGRSWNPLAQPTSDISKWIAISCDNIYYTHRYVYAHPLLVYAASCTRDALPSIFMSWIQSPCLHEGTRKDSSKSGPLHSSNPSSTPDTRTMCLPNAPIPHPPSLCDPCRVGISHTDTVQQRGRLSALSLRHKRRKMHMEKIYLYRESCRGLNWPIVT